MTPARPRVAVIGGGVIGCAVAWRLARRDAAVVIIERDRPGARASSAAAGMLSPLKEAVEPGPFLDLALRSLERYPGFVQEVEAASGMDTGFRRDGRLDVALSDEEAAVLRRHHELQAETGFDSRLLEPAELRRLEPAVTPEATLGLATEHDHQIGARRLARALWLAVHHEGGEVLTGARVERVALSDDGGRAVGVRLETGETVDADVVVVAAGAWSGRVGLPRPLPVRPVRGQIVVLRTVPTALGRTTWGPACYLVPRRDGRLLVGATMEEAGFRARATAAGVGGLLAAATRIVPVLSEAEILGFQVGLRPATPDGLPVIGRDPRVEGLLFATGHFRNGILLAPETAEQIATMVLDDAPGHPAFSPDRFPGGEEAGT